MTRTRADGGGVGVTTAQGYVQDNREANEPFLGGGELLALVDLLPEREVVVRTAVHVRLEGDARCPVEHEVGYLQLAVKEVKRRLSKN